MLRHLDGGQRRDGEFCKMNVVKPNHRQFIWNLDFSFIRLAHDSNRGHIVGTKNGSRRLIKCVEFSESFHAAFETVVADFNQVCGKPYFSHGRSERIASGDCGPQVLRSCDKSDPAVAQSREVRTA